MYKGPGANAVTKDLGDKISLVGGTTANTNIAITNIKMKDRLVSVIGFDPDNATPADQVVDFTATTKITSAGNIQCTASTAGYDLEVHWLKFSR